MSSKRFLHEFMQVGNLAYGLFDSGSNKLSRYSSSGYSRTSPLDLVEYFGRIKASEGANIDKEKVKVPVKRQEAINKFYINNNPGNIKKGTFGGQTWGGKTYEGKKTGTSYRKYNSKEEGLVDIINVIKNYQTNDLKRIINKYAQNDESGKVYKSYYKDLNKVLPKKLDFNDNNQMKNLMKVITVVENKSNSVPPGLYYKEEDFDKAINLYNSLNESQIIPERKPFKYGGQGQSRRGGLKGGRRAGPGQGQGGGGNKETRQETRDEREARQLKENQEANMKSIKESGMVKESMNTKTVKQNFNNNSFLNDFNITYANPEPIEETNIVKQIQDKYTFDAMGDTYVGYTSEDGKYNIGITGSLDSIGAGIKFNFGGKE
jgi:hypothetical protein